MLIIYTNLLEIIKVKMKVMMKLLKIQLLKN